MKTTAIYHTLFYKFLCSWPVDGLFRLKGFVILEKNLVVFDRIIMDCF